MVMLIRVMVLKLLSVLAFDLGVGKSIGADGDCNFGAALDDNIDIHCHRHQTPKKLQKLLRPWKSLNPRNSRTPDYLETPENVET